MCLDNIKTTNLPVITEGFKVFKRSMCFRKGKWTLFGVHRNQCTYTKRRWVVDASTKVIMVTPLGRHYLTGFHCFRTKEDAIKYSEQGEKIHRVLVKDITAVGEQGEFNCFAARSIYIMEEVSREEGIK